MDIQAQVLDVTQGKTGTGKDKWTVKFSNGESITAWDYSVAAKAQQAQQAGAVVTASIQEKPRGGGGVWKNLTGITTSAPLPAATGQIPQETPGGRQNGAGGFTGGMSPEDKVRVTKLSCLSTAATVYSGSGDLDAVLEAAKAIFAEVYPQPTAAPAAGQQEVVQQLVAALPAVQVGTQGVEVRAAPVAALPWTAA